MEKKEGIPCILYLYIHSKLRTLTNTDTIEEKRFRSFLFQWKIPESLRPIVIKEMELLGLITRQNRFTIKFNTSKFNQENLKPYYKNLGLWEK